MLNTPYELKQKNIVVLLPAYNESQTISETIGTFHVALPDAFILVVNNNSTDDTERLAKACLESLKCRGTVVNEFRQGKANAVRRAFLEVDADIYLMADADMTYPAERAIDLIDPILRGEADMVVGDRHTGGEYARENKRMLHGFGNNLVQSLVNFLFKSDLVDIMSGYRACSREFVKNYPILVEGFEIETDITLHALHRKFRVIEVPVAYKDRPNGSVSKLNTITDGARVLFTIAQIMRYYRPLFFFGGASLFFCVAGLAVGFPVIREYISTHYITHIPLAILATGIEMIGGVFMAIGLVLDSIAHQSSMEFQIGLLHSKRNLEL